MTCQFSLKRKHLEEHLYLSEKVLKCLSLTGALEQVENTRTAASQCQTLLAVNKGGFKTLMQIDKSMGWFKCGYSAVDYTMQSLQLYIIFMRKIIHLKAEGVLTT